MDLQISRRGEVKRCTVPEAGGTLGGGEHDAIRVEGAGAALLTLRPAGEFWTLEAKRPLRVGGVFMPALVRRIWLPDELLELPCGTRVTCLPVARARLPGTVAILQDLLGAGDQVDAPAIPSLFCLTGAESGRRFLLTDRETIAGRAVEVGLRLRDDSVSRRHLRIRKEGGQIQVEDLGSPNGVFVNGRRAVGRVVLADGAVVELGQTVLRYRAPVVAPPVPPPPPLDASARPVAPLSQAEVVTPIQVPPALERSRLRALAVQEPGAPELPGSSDEPASNDGAARGAPSPEGASSAAREGHPVGGGASAAGGVAGAGSGSAKVKRSFERGPAVALSKVGSVAPLAAAASTRSPQAARTLLVAGGVAVVGASLCLAAFLL